MKLNEYIGQEPLKAMLRPELVQALKTGNVLPHVLLKGMGGVGKSALAKAIAGELGYKFTFVTDPATLTPHRVSRLLLELSRNGYDKGGRPSVVGDYDKHVIMIDEIHKLPQSCLESWYEPMTDYQLAQAAGIWWLPYFTVIGATTNPERLPAPFRRRFLLTYELQPYTVEDLVEMVTKRYQGYNRAWAVEVAKRARRNAALALNYAERVANYGGLGWFDVAGIDAEGLDGTMRAYLKALEGTHGRSMSLGTLAAKLQLDPSYVRGEVEPFLLSLGLVSIDGRGRTLEGAAPGARTIDPANFFASSSDVPTGRRVRKTS